MSKNIVIFSDGTGQEGGERNNTNIYKLFNMIEDRSSKQVAFYDAGLGSNWQKITGSIGGMGISRNIKQCYQFIFEHYEIGDQIYLFGFSRGSATIRSLSSFIHHFGILPKSRPELIDQAYSIYKIRDENLRDKKAVEFVKKHHNIWTSVKFIGCFDTVAALGLPWKRANAILNYMPYFHHKFHDFTLSQSIEHAYHALAIDDEREAFLPILWDKTINEKQSLKQVWFCGMHTDVGGGYKEQNLSDIPLEWMLQNAMKHGLLIYAKNMVNISKDADGIMHNSRGTKLSQFYPKEIRSFDPQREDKPIVHQSVLDRKKNCNNEDSPAYNPWILKLNYEVEPWVLS